MEEDNNIFNDIESDKIKHPMTVEDIKKDFEASMTFNECEIASIDENLSYMNGEINFKAREGYSRYVPKSIKKQAEWMYAELEEPFLGSDKLFELQQVSGIDSDTLKRDEMILDKQFSSDICRVSLINNMSRAVVDEGTAILKVGWEYISKDMYVNETIHTYPTEEEAGFMLNSMPEAKGLPDTEVMAMLDQIINTPISSEVVRIKKTILVRNRPTINVKDYNNIYFDPSCNGDIKKAKFVIEKFKTSLSELRQVPKYKNLDKIRSSSSTIYTDDHNDFDFEDDPRKILNAYEYIGEWDIDGSGITTSITATVVEDTLVHFGKNPFPYSFNPYSVATFSPVKNRVRGNPLGHLIKDDQDIIGALSRGLIDVVGRSANGQEGIRENSLSPLNQLKFERGEKYSFGEHIDPSTLVYTHKYPEIPQSAIFMINSHQANIDSMTGTKSFSQNISGDSLGKTATGARGVLDSMSKRKLSVIRRMANALEDAGRKIVQMNHFWLEDEDVAKYTGEDNPPPMVKIENFNISVGISTDEIDNREIQTLSFLLQTIGNTMPEEIKKEIFADIAYLSKRFKLSKSILEYTPEPNQTQIELDRLEIELLKAKIETEKSKSRENESDSVLNMARSKFELSRAKDYDSAGDLKDLDFIEKEMGIDHDRKKELKSMDVDSKEKIEDIKMRSKLNVIDAEDNGLASLTPDELSLVQDDTQEDEYVEPEPNIEDEIGMPMDQFIKQQEDIVSGANSEYN